MSEQTGTGNEPSTEQQSAPKHAAPRVKPIPARVTAAPASNKTVYVACKFEPGLDLQLCKKEEYWEDTPSGAKLRERWMKRGAIVRVNGPSYPVGQPPVGFPERPQMIHGYAITVVSEDFWDAWLAQNKGNPLVVSGNLFADERIERVQAQTREFKDVRSGFQPMTPDKDPRMPGSLNANVTRVATADEMKSRLPAAQ